MILNVKISEYGENHLMYNNTSRPKHGEYYCVKYIKFARKVYKEIRPQGIRRYSHNLFYVFQW